MTDYPTEICWDCGKKHGRATGGRCATFYPGTCGWCGEAKIVTEPRDYGYPLPPPPSTGGM